MHPILYVLVVTLYFIYYSNMHTIINIYSINTVSAHATDKPFAIALQV